MSSCFLGIVEAYFMEGMLHYFGYQKSQKIINFFEPNIWQQNFDLCFQSMLKSIWVILSFKAEHKLCVNK